MQSEIGSEGGEECCNKRHDSQSRLPSMMMCSGTITPVSIDRSRYIYIYISGVNEHHVGRGQHRLKHRLRHRHRLRHSREAETGVMPFIGAEWKDFPGLPAACDLQMRRVGGRIGSRRRRGWIHTSRCFEAGNGASVHQGLGVLFLISLVLERDERDARDLFSRG